MHYKCELCKYETGRKFCFDKHLESKKHIDKSNDTNKQPIVPNRTKNTIEYTNNNINMDDFCNDHNSNCNVTELVCNYCHTQFTRKSSLLRHQDGRCKEKIKYDASKELEIERLQNENKQLKSQNKELKKYSTKTETELEYFKELFKETSKSNKTSPSTITYVLNNYQDAPPLLCLDDYSQLNDSKNMDLVEVLIHHQENNKLDHFIGDYLIGEYKKTDPSEQSIWNSDTTRLTYIIKEVLKSNKSNWRVDKKGVKTKEYIIDPLLSYIKPLIKEYTIQQSYELHNLTDYQAKKMLNNLTLANIIMKNINDGILSADIIKYLAPHFYLNKEQEDIKLLK